MIENFQKMRNFLITKIRNFDSFSFRDVSYSFVPRVMRDGVDTLARARPVCIEALIFISYSGGSNRHYQNFFFQILMLRKHCNVQ